MGFDGDCRGMSRGLKMRRRRETEKEEESAACSPFPLFFFSFFFKSLRLLRFVSCILQDSLFLYFFLACSLRRDWTELVEIVVNRLFVYRTQLSEFGEFPPSLPCIWSSSNDDYRVLTLTATLTFLRLRFAGWSLEMIFVIPIVKLISLIQRCPLLLRFLKFSRKFQSYSCHSNCFLHLDVGKVPSSP